VKTNEKLDVLLKTLSRSVTLFIAWLKHALSQILSGPIFGCNEP